MIRPTLRGVLVFAVGIPLALLIVSVDSNLWALSFDYGLLALLIGASDWALACRWRSLKIEIATPNRLYIGERGATTLSISAGGFRRVVRFEAIAEQSGEIEPSEVVAGQIPAGGAGRVALPIAPLRRGRVTVDQIWLRWRGPLGLVEFIHRIPLNRSVDVVPNVRGVHGTALQFF